MNLEEVEKILANLTAAPSALEFDYKFEVKEIFEDYHDMGGGTIKESNGFHIRVMVWRKDTNTGEYDWGPSRWNHTPQETTEKGVVMTAWLCLEQYVKHELMESFLYGGARILDPHNSIDELAWPNKVKR